ncbi:chromosome partitioning protein ParA, partial [Vibrio splendidus]
IVKSVVILFKKRSRSHPDYTSYSKEELKIIVPSYLPAFSKGFGIAITDYKMITENIAVATYCIHHKEESDEEGYANALGIIDTVKAAFKEERKARENLYVKAIKTNLTEEQYKHFKALMHSYNYNYNSAAAFLRDVAINQLDVKPNNHDEFVSYFRETKKLANTLEDIADDIGDGNSNKELTRIIRELISNISNTRKLAIDSHSSATATSLAKKYLSAKQLKALYLEALDKEADL